MNSFSVISILWVLSEILLARIKLSRVPRNDKDKHSLRVLWLTISVSILMGVLINNSGYGTIFNNPQYIHFTGLSLIIFGPVIRWIAIISLKSMFTVDVSIHKNHKIIKSGIYKYLRHPAYLGSLIPFLGLGIAFVNWLTTLIIFIPIFLSFNNRIKIEECVLVAEFEMII